jgi:hypothetical protein
VNALDQSARVVDFPLQKRLIAGSIASNCSPSFCAEKIFRKLCVEYLAMVDKVCIIITCKRQSRATNTEPRTDK